MFGTQRRPPPAAKAPRRWCRGVLLASCSRQQPCDRPKQDGGMKGLDQKRFRLKRANIKLGGIARQYQHGNPTEAALPHLAEKLGTIEFRHHQIEENEVRAQGFQSQYPLLPIGGLTP
jgi:hypothetical protein